MTSRQMKDILVSLCKARAILKTSDEKPWEEIWHKTEEKIWLREKLTICK